MDGWIAQGSKCRGGGHSSKPSNVTPCCLCSPHSHKFFNATVTVSSRPVCSTCRQEIARLARINHGCGLTCSRNALPASPNPTAAASAASRGCLFLPTVRHMGQREMLWSNARAKHGLQNVWPQGVVTASGRQFEKELQVRATRKMFYSVAAFLSRQTNSSNSSSIEALSSAILTIRTPTTSTHPARRTAACTGCSLCHQLAPPACGALARWPAPCCRCPRLPPGHCRPLLPRRRPPAHPPGLPAAAAAAPAAARAWAALTGLLCTLPPPHHSAPAGSAPCRGTAGPLVHLAHPQAAGPALRLRLSGPEPPAGLGRAQKSPDAPTVGRGPGEGGGEQAASSAQRQLCMLALTPAKWLECDHVAYKTPNIGPPGRQARSAAAR